MTHTQHTPGPWGIAAAPELLMAARELLEALKEQVALWEAAAIVGGVPDANSWKHIYRKCDKARAAIAKAEGK